MAILIRFFKSLRQSIREELNLGLYKLTGKKPWTYGYETFRWKIINKILINDEIIKKFSDYIPDKLGKGIDERIVEYPWVINNLKNSRTKLLDAGSALNYPYIIFHPLIKQKEIIICNLNPENECFYRNNISYIFSDLRNLPFKDEIFDEVVSISTIEHIAMDNSIYIGKNSEENTVLFKYEYLKAIKELIRVLKYKGILLITVPYGKYEDHKFFQQFNEEMIQKIIDTFSEYGCFSKTYYRYNINWILSNEKECVEELYYDFHSKKNRLQDDAAAARAVCCIKFEKNDLGRNNS